MKRKKNLSLKRVRDSALSVLRHNFPEEPDNHPRTAAWGYPEPYTRDLMVSSLGVMASGDDDLISSVRSILKALAENQSSHGLVPGLVDNPEDLGASDTTSLFLLGLEVFRRFCGETAFLNSSSDRAYSWLRHQSPFNNGLVAQLPTTDWRDEQWVFGYGLYVNSLTYLWLKLAGLKREAREVKDFLNSRLYLERKNYYALYAFKLYKSQRFDLLGNSLAIIAGLADQKRGRKIARWVKERCADLNRDGDLKGDLPPVLIPYIRPGDEDWRPRYRDYNLPGEYHNGGLWPFVIGFYVVALIKLNLLEEAERILTSLARLVTKSKDPGLSCGFNEWHKAQTGRTGGHDWQTWSAANFLYASECFRRQQVLFLDP